MLPRGNQLNLSQNTNEFPYVDIDTIFKTIYFLVVDLDNSDAPAGIEGSFRLHADKEEPLLSSHTHTPQTLDHLYNHGGHLSR